MDVEFKLFPAFYLRAYCKDHSASVELNIQESVLPDHDSPIGLQITPIRCPEGGMGPGAPCLSSWSLGTSVRDLKISS